MIRFGDVAIDEAKREARVRDEVQPLEPKAFDVLWLLATNPQRVVPRAEIFKSVWGELFVSESALTTRIKEIRRAVGDDGRAQRVIKSARGTGYRFVAAVDSMETAGSLETGGSHGLRAPRPCRRRGFGSSRGPSSAAPER